MCKIIISNCLFHCFSSILPSLQKYPCRNAYLCFKYMHARLWPASLHLRYLMDIVLRANAGSYLTAENGGRCGCAFVRPNCKIVDTVCETFPPKCDCVHCLRHMTLIRGISLSVLNHTHLGFVCVRNIGVCCECFGKVFGFSVFLWRLKRSTLCVRVCAWMLPDSRLSPKQSTFFCICDAGTVKISTKQYETIPSAISFWHPLPH